MRLINTTTYILEDFADPDVPPYAILSHRWGPTEISFQDYEAKTHCEGPGIYGFLTERQTTTEADTNVAGYRKIISACRFARAREHEWLWIDTCCIDKRSSAELSEAVNSMYRWYSDAEECYAYLPDVAPFSSGDKKVYQTFEASEWWSRGWTLQELLAPRYLTFCTCEWEAIGVKSSSDGGRDLSRTISSITGIPRDVLQDQQEMTSYSAAQRLSWAARRETTRVEDRAYSLLGLFGVYMPLLYGERNQAFLRLLEEILRTSNDETLFAWYTGSLRVYHQAEMHKRFVLQHYLLLPGYPIAYEHCGRIRQSSFRGNPRFTFKNGLIKLKVEDMGDLIYVSQDTVCVVLKCTDGHAMDLLAQQLEPGSFGPARRRIFLQRRACGHFARVEFEPPLEDVEELFPSKNWQSVTKRSIFYIHASTTPCEYGLDSIGGSLLGH